MNADISFRNIVILVLLVCSLANLILGSLVFIDSPARKVNRIFSLLASILSLWIFSLIGFNFVSSQKWLHLWTCLIVMCVMFLPSIFFHLVVGSLGTAVKGDDAISSSHWLMRFRYLFYVASAGLFGITIYSSRNHYLYHQDTGFYFPNLGDMFWLSALVYVVLSGVSIFLLILHSRSARDPNQKSRLIYLLIGSFMLIVVGGFNVNMIGGFQHSAGGGLPFGFLIMSVCLALVAYALTTSQLYHFSELFRKSIAFFSMTTILLSMFGGTLFLSKQVLAPYFPQSDFFALGIASIFMSLIFHPLRFRVQNVVDRFFFARRYDQMQRLRGLSRRVLSSADRDELMNIFFTSLQSIGFGSIALLLKDPQKPFFNIKRKLNLDPHAEGFFLRSDSLLIQYVREEKEEVIRDEVTRRVMADWERQTLIEELSLLQAEIVFPLFSPRRRALFGLITLGNSEFGYSSYKGRNIFWLKAVIDNAGIMLDNFYHQEFASALVPYVGRTWADEMRRNKEGFRERLSGHRTWVSIVMVDIRHFTNMSAKMDPQQVVGLLKDFRSRVAEVVYRYQGTIDKFIGDAIMIVFGLPILPSINNPDKNAVECAKAIMKEVSHMNEQRFESGEKQRISIGIGISSGEVIAGNVDSGDRVEYTVIGDAANMVARLEDLAGDNQILISPATYSRVKGTVNVNSWLPRKIEGFEGQIIVHELLPSDDVMVDEPTSEPRLVVNE